MEGVAVKIVLWSVPLYIVAVILYAVRAFRGPTVPDSVLAVDCISFDTAALMLIFALLFRSPFLIAPSLALVLWVYLLDLYVAKYLEDRGRKK